MKKFFEEPSIDCLILRTENITDIISGLGDSDGTRDEGWNV